MLQRVLFVLHCGQWSPFRDAPAFTAWELDKTKTSVVVTVIVLNVATDGVFV